MNLKQAISTIGTAAALAIVAGSASGSPIFPTFVVDSSVLGAGAGTVNPFTANDIAGEYNETLTFTSTTTFSVAIQFSAGQFVLDDTGGNTTYNAAQTGLGINYGLYALYDGTGTFSTPGGVDTFTLNPGGTFNLVLDPKNDTTFTQPTDGTSPYTTTGTTGSDDLSLASGAAVNGLGAAFTAANLAGAFGQTTSISLTPDGMSFFTAPSPFYTLSLESGQFEPPTSTGAGATDRFTGTINANFVAVPEPSIIALIGVALLGLGFTSRRSMRA